MIDGYDGLVTAVQDWLDGPSDRLVAAIPDMIAMAEADFRRQIVVPDMEVQVAIDPTSDNLPADVDSVRSFVLLGDTRQTLEQVSLAQFYDLPQDQTGTPTYFAVTNNKPLIWPASDDDYLVLLTYRQMIPSLSSDNQSNWLIASHPDAYLYGSICRAEFYGWNDERVVLAKALLAEIIESINTAGTRKRYSGPLIMRPAVDEGGFRYGYATFR